MISLVKMDDFSNTNTDLLSQNKAIPSFWLSPKSSNIL